MGLSAKFVESVSEAGKYYDLHGLFLHVRPSGAKKWLQRYTFKGRRREIGLGSAKIVSVSSARKKALQNLLLIHDGIDPIEAKKQDAAIPIFEVVARKVHEENRPTWRNAKHAAQFIKTLEVYAFPIIGSKPVNEVNSSHILQILSPIWVTKAETAKRVRQRLSTVFKYCVAQQWRPDDPANMAIIKALPNAKKKVQHRKSLSYDDVSAFIQKVRKSSAAISTKLAIEFLILTATRSGEVRNARWSEIEGSLWTIPSERMKAGIAHRVPLSSRCMKILDEAKRINQGSDFVFEGTKQNRPLSENTFNKLMKELGVEVHAHGFRTSFRTWTQEKTNYPREIAETALAHSIKDKAEAAYARSDLLAKRAEMMEAWARFIRSEEADVINFRA
ncbi:tyrosine-type recombinase/integrase [Pelagovum sp. HNIBRBA483]|uniref:tyrosine-type recombinase/integrase n=1 Tax=Pelagovum sp. HNIBRBA483 TaxID=3233341 RepID=UPI0034A4A72A